MSLEESLLASWFGGWADANPFETTFLKPNKVTDIQLLLTS